MRIVIEQTVGPKSSGRAYAWQLGWSANAWVVFAGLALLAAITAFAFETEVDRSTGVAVFEIGWASVFLIGIILAALVDAVQNRRRAKAILFPDAERTYTSFVEIDDSAVTYGLRECWRTRLAWSLYQRHQVTRHTLMLHLGSIELHIPRQALSNDELVAIEDHIRGLSTPDTPTTTDEDTPP